MYGAIGVPELVKAKLSQEILLRREISQRGNEEEERKIRAVKTTNSGLRLKSGIRLALWGLSA